MRTENRNPVYDIMKGIGIIAVLVGHSVDSHSLIYHFVCSFHMPLFFILSGFFSKPEAFNVCLHKSFKRLLIPAILYLILAAILVSFKMIAGIASLDHLLNCIIWVKSPIWFLFALFWGKLFFSIFPFNKIWLYLFSVLFLSFSDTIPELPFAVKQGIGCLPFLIMGSWFRKYKVSTAKIGILVFSFFAWCLSLTLGGLDMHECEYRLGLIDIIGATGEVVREL